MNYLDWFWLKNQNLLCKNCLYKFQIFWRYRKVSSEVSILRYQYLRWVSKLRYQKVLTLKMGMKKYRYLNFVSKWGIQKYRYLKKVSIPNTNFGSSFHIPYRLWWIKIDSLSPSIKEMESKWNKSIWFIFSITFHIRDGYHFKYQQYYIETVC